MTIRLKGAMQSCQLALKYNLNWDNYSFPQISLNKEARKAKWII